MRIIKLSFFLLIITACSESDLMIHKQNGLMLEDLKEKNTVINFWADWCPPCIKEIPELNALYEENKDELNVYLFHFDELAIKGIQARGNRVSTKAIQRVRILPKQNPGGVQMSFNSNPGGGEG
mgnify:CR=1 FL=1